MHDSIRRRALRGAAQVAWLSLGVGCGGAVAASAETQTSGGTSAGGAAQSALGGVGHGSGGGAVGGDLGAGGERQASSAGGALATHAGGTEQVAASGGTEQVAGSGGAEQPKSACKGLADSALVGCCNGLLAPYVPAESRIAQIDLARNDSEVVACCGAVAALAKIPNNDFAAVQNCCYVTNFPDGICTPWGPPVPPEYVDVSSVSSQVGWA